VAATSTPDITGAFVHALWPFALFLPVILALRLALDRLEARTRQRARERRQGTLEQRLERAALGMSTARELLDGVEAELAARQSALVRLEAETRDWENLARLKREEADAVGRLLRHELSRGETRAFWQGALLNTAFFGLGVVVQWLLT